MSRFVWLVCVGLALAFGCGSVDGNKQQDAAVDGAGSGSTHCVLDQAKLDGCKL